MKAIFFMRFFLYLSCAVVGLSAVGCGQDDSSYGFAPVVSMDPLLADETRTLSFYAFGPQRSDGIFLTCATLMSQALLPDDAKLDRLGRTDVILAAGGAQTARVGGVTPGQRRFLYIEARDPTNTIIGNGCAEDITVGEGASVDVNVTIYRL